MKRKTDKTILVISDPHFPFEAKDFDRQIELAKREYQPDLVVCLGDLVDQHGLGRWTPDSDAPGNCEELEAARDSIARLGARFPQMLCCYGNHDLRFLRKIKSVGIPSCFAKDLREVVRAPDDWKFEMCYEIDGVIYFHGDGLSGDSALQAALQRYHQSVVFGHVHSAAGIQYAQGPTQRMWAMNAGCMIDATAMAFAYGKNQSRKPVICYAVVINGVPHIIPC